MILPAVPIAAARREMVHRVLEREYPGIREVVRDLDGSYVLSEACDLEAADLLGLTLRTADRR
jgi:hypothetical protein